MPEMVPTEWQGRLRTESSDASADDRCRPLSEAERDALEAWLPRGAYLLAHIRGDTATGEPVHWAITTDGLLLASLREEQPQRVRARVQWVPARDLRRVDVFQAQGTCLLRVVTAMRRHVLQGVDERAATRFMAHVNAAIAAATAPRRLPRLIGVAQ